MRNQRGVSLLIVLLLLAVLLLAGLSMARVGADATLSAGSTAWRDGAMQASEVGLADAAVMVQGLASAEADQPSLGYFATRRVDDAAGLPTGFDWTAMPGKAVGPYTVRHVVERQCSGTLPIADPTHQCLLTTLTAGVESSRKAGADSFAMPTAQQYRVTVSVSGPRDTAVMVQSAVIR